MAAVVTEGFFVWSAPRTIRLLCLNLRFGWVVNSSAWFARGSPVIPGAAGDGGGVKHPPSWGSLDMMSGDCSTLWGGL